MFYGLLLHITGLDVVRLPTMKAGGQESLPILVLLITNTYENEPNNCRYLKGVAMDRNELFHAFTKLCNFIIEDDLENLPLHALEEKVLDKLSRKNIHAKYGGLIVVFSGHGGKRPCLHAKHDAESPSIMFDKEHSLILANDGNKLHLSDCSLEQGCIHKWADQFDQSVSEPGLPKYFLLDCCRSKPIIKNLKFHEPKPTKGPMDLNITIAYATSDNNKTSCDPDEGSPWTAELCKLLNAIEPGENNQTTLLDVLKAVKKNMNNEPEIDEKHSNSLNSIYVCKNRTSTVSL